jgi:hypothetical protein
MTLQSRRGEAVTLAVMGIMMFGMFLWMFSGHSHLSAMHGGRNPASEVRNEEHHGTEHDPSDGRMLEDRGSIVRDREELRSTSLNDRSP